jgi:hypothetical protein
MLYTPRLIPTADSSMSSVVRSRFMTRWKPDMCAAAFIGICNLYDIAFPDLTVAKVPDRKQSDMMYASGGNIAFTYNPIRKVAAA